MSKVYSAGITGTGSSLPDKILFNYEIEKFVDTSDEWIRTRTGIGSRRICDNGMKTSDLATKAAERALQDAGLNPEDLELIVVGTVTGDAVFPSTACIVQKNIGACKAAAFDVQAACAGFMYALTAGEQFVKSGMFKNALIIGADIMSRILNWKDRSTCVLFGDGAGAVVLERAEDGFGILASHIGADGSCSEVLTAGITIGYNFSDIISKEIEYLKMDGSEVFKFAVRTMEKTTVETLKKCNLSIEDVDFLIPHQANIRIIDAGAKRLKLAPEQVYINLEQYGNMSAASVPVALDEAVKKGLIKKGHVLVFVGFGAGLTWGCSIVKWCK